MKKFLCAVFFVLVLAGLSYAAEDAGTVSIQDFVAQANNSLKFDRLYKGKYVTVTGCKVERVEARDNDYVLGAWNGDWDVGSVYFTFTTANAEQIVDLDGGDIVTIRGFVRRDKNLGDPTLYNCKIIK